jgi:ankyrin repeat protein
MVNKKITYAILFLLTIIAMSSVVMVYLTIAKRTDDHHQSKESFESGCTSESLHQAIMADDVQLIRACSSNESINELNTDGLSALHIASYYDSKKVTQFLIDNKANLDVPANPDLSTPLMKAAQKANIEIIIMLLKRGANIEAKDYFGNIAAQYVKASKFKDLAEALKSNESWEAADKVQLARIIEAIKNAKKKG